MRLVVFSLFCLALTSCLTEATPVPIAATGTGNAEASGPSGDAAEGFTLYEDQCAMCHDSIEDSYEDSAKSEASFDRISGAGDVGAHSGIDPWLSDDDSANVAAALTAPVAEADAENGASLYEDSCAMCHGDLAESAKKGRSEDDITGSADISSHSSVDPFPTGQDVVDIAAALAE